jgi:hypothetical protein
MQYTIKQMQHEQNHGFSLKIEQARRLRLRRSGKSANMQENADTPHWQTAIMADE